MHECGATPEHLARVAVAARKWASLNPKAWIREPLTVDEVLASPMICDPLHKLDCCLVTDGGGVVIVTGRERARDARKKPIGIIGAGESHLQWHVAQCPDLTVTPGVVSGREAFGMAGIKPSDVHVFEPYDNFTHSVLLYLEDLGFCKKGEAGEFVASGHLDPGGKLPSMTSGEVCRTIIQVRWVFCCSSKRCDMRGEAGDRQVPNAEIAVAHGTGGRFLDRFNSGAGA